MRDNSSRVLTEAVNDLSLATTIEEVTKLVAVAARELTGADGATFVFRDGDKCHYADEDAISPLWKGGRFPLSACISGWAMINKQHVVIPDIYLDGRIPHDAYRPTFVKSLCMMPIRNEMPLGAIGTYWKDGYCPSPEEVKLLQSLANSTSIALTNLELKQNLITSGETYLSMTNRQRELESAIQTLVHDIRSPLNTVMLLTELLESDLSDAGLGLNKHIDALKVSAEQMNEQMKRMLSLYGITQRKLQVEPVNLSQMAEEVAHDQLRKVPDRKIKFEISQGLSTVADKVLLHVAVENLLGNAVKYAGQKDIAVIQVRQEANGGSLSTFFVKDNGDGFESTEASRLFRPLVRLHNHQEFVGTGLGLASVARIIEMHGGSVKAEGEKSVGATFFFRLPRSA